MQRSLISSHPIATFEQMTPSTKKNKGVMLVILGVVVFCIGTAGILAAIAIPAFINYVERAKAAEVEGNLSALFLGAEAYYESEHFNGNGVIAPTADVSTHCLVNSATSSNVPTDKKVVVDWATENPAFAALNFAAFGAVYYRYEIVSRAAGCGQTTPGPAYTFRAIGDLDYDGTTSLYELAAQITEEGRLRRTSFIFVQNELE